MDIIIVLFILTGIIVFKEILSKNSPVYTVHKFVCLYALIFWVIVPLFQYINNRYPWGIDITDENALIANTFILMFILIYNFIYKFLSKKKCKENGDNFPIVKFIIYTHGILILLFFQILIFVFFYIHAGGIVFFRGEGFGVIAATQPMHLIIDRVFRSFSIFSAILILINFKNNKTSTNLFYLFVSLFLVLLTNFPFAIPRYMAGAFYIGLIFSIKPYLKNRILPYLGLLFLFLIIYPIASHFRLLSTFTDIFTVGMMNTDSFFSGDFDNYSTLNMAIIHVENYGITYGRQLLGVLFFFIPRSLWPNKPIGSGHFVAAAKDWDFTNISMPIIGEGYINFGIAGIFIFAVIFACFVAKLDCKFYKLGKLNFYKIFYPVVLGMIFFIARGDLMSSFAFSTGFAVSAFLIKIIIKKHIKYI